MCVSLSLSLCVCVKIVVSLRWYPDNWRQRGDLTISGHGSFLSLTHTLTHTHMLGFHLLWGLSIDVMVFILYKLYILSPYTAPLPKPNHHRRHSAILHFQKTSLSLIYKLVSSWGPKNVPTRTRILDIAIVVGTFCPHNVGYT